MLLIQIKKDHISAVANWCLIMSKVLLWGNTGCQKGNFQKGELKGSKVNTCFFFSYAFSSTIWDFLLCVSQKEIVM